MTPVSGSADYPASPPRLYLIRHGETAWSKSGRHTGRTDIPLTLHGEAAARGLRRWLGQVQFTRILTSPSLRARQTCDLAGLGLLSETEPDLREWDYGEYEGRRSTEIREQRAGWNLFRDGCPGGESPSQLAERVQRLIRRLSALQGDLALFSHGQFGSVLAAMWIGLPIADGQHFTLGPASTSILTWSTSHPDVRVIELWNLSPQILANGRL